MSIPKIIHQTWKTQEIPPELVFCVESWKKLNPDWQYILWTDEEMDVFVKKYFPEIHGVYVSYPTNIFRADLFRLLVVYQMGGVYADLDMECLKPLDFLLAAHVGGKEFAISFEPPAQSIGIFNKNRLYAANFLIACLGNEILGGIIKFIVRNKIVELDVLGTTGPIAITKSLADFLPNEKAAIIDWRVVNPILDISNESLRPLFRRQSLKMFLRREYYPESCLVHYWHGSYWNLKQPLLFLKKEEVVERLRLLNNPIHYFFENLKYFSEIVFLRRVYRFSHFLKCKYGWYKKLIEFIKK